MAKKDKEDADKREIPVVYDYWVDRDENKIYALVQYINKKTDDKHSNVCLLSKDYHGK